MYGPAARCLVMRAAGRVAVVLALILPAFGAGAAVLVPPPQYASGQSTSPQSEEETHTDGEPRTVDTRAPAPGPAPQRFTRTRASWTAWMAPGNAKAPSRAWHRRAFLPRRTAPPAPDDPDILG